MILDTRVKKNCTKHHKHNNRQQKGVRQHQNTMKLQSSNYNRRFQRETTEDDQQLNAMLNQIVTELSRENIEPLY